jgi:hypothetical protein
VKTVLKKIEKHNNTDLPGPTKIRFGLVVVKPKTNQLHSFLIMLLQISKLVLLMTTIYTCLLELQNLNLDVIQNSKRLENKILPSILQNDDIYEILWNINCYFKLFEYLKINKFIF